MEKRVAFLTIIMVVVTAMVGYSTGKEVMEHFKSNGWTFMVHLKPVPKQHQKMVNATHHLAVTVKTPQGQAVSDMTVKFIFRAKGKIIAQGELKYMSGTPSHSEGHGGHAHEGHYGADITLPGAGDYNLTLVAKGGKNLTVRATGNIKISD